MADDTDAGLPVRTHGAESAETLYGIGAFLGCFAVNIPIYWQYLEGFEPILNINPKRVSKPSYG